MELLHIKIIVDLVLEHNWMDWFGMVRFYEYFLAIVFLP